MGPLVWRPQVPLAGLVRPWPRGSSVRGDSRPVLPQIHLRAQGSSLNPPQNGPLPLRDQKVTPAFTSLIHLLADKWEVGARGQPPSLYGPLS